MANSVSLRIALAQAGINQLIKRARLGCVYPALNLGNVVQVRRWKIGEAQCSRARGERTHQGIEGVFAAQ